MNDINKLQKRLGIILLVGGVHELRDVYKVSNSQKVSFGALTNIFRSVRPNIPVPIKDTQFALAGWNIWQDFLTSVITVLKIPYHPEIWDCDDYANLVKALSALFLLLNSCGIAHCTVYDKNSGAKVGGHYCNLIATKDNEVYLFDLNNPGFIKVELNKDPVVKAWIYKNIDRCEL